MALLGFASLLAQAPRPRPLPQGTNSTAQTARGQQVYRAQCANCHGGELEGSAGPPLAGDGFLSNWSARSLAQFVDKIQKTMPFDQPGSLSRPQSIDLAAYIFYFARVGSGAVTEATLARTTFPTTRTSKTPQPEGNLATVERLQNGEWILVDFYNPERTT